MSNIIDVGNEEEFEASSIEDLSPEPTEQPHKR